MQILSPSVNKEPCDDDNDDDDDIEIESEESGDDDPIETIDDLRDYPDDWLLGFSQVEWKIKENL